MCNNLLQCLTVSPKPPCASPASRYPLRCLYRACLLVALPRSALDRGSAVSSSNQAEQPSDPDSPCHYQNTPQLMLLEGERRSLTPPPPLLPSYPPPPPVLFIHSTPFSPPPLFQGKDKVPSLPSSPPPKPSCRQEDTRLGGRGVWSHMQCSAQ